MNMLAKVVKSQTAVEFAPFFVPEIGESKSPAESNAEFIFPNAIDVSPVETTVEEVSSAGYSTDEILQEAREEAARIVAEAEANVSMIEAAARERGLMEAQATIEAEMTAQMDELRAQMTATINQIAGLQNEIAARAEVDLVEFALEIAKKIVNREVTIDREIAVALVRVSLKKLHDRSMAEVHLHPDDYQYVQMHREKLEFKGALDLISDAAISPGGCLIHTETGDIDARIESQFDEISHGLLGN